MAIKFSATARSARMNTITTSVGTARNRVINVIVVDERDPTVVVTEANQPIGVSSSGKATYAVSVEGSERRVKVSP